MNVPAVLMMEVWICDIGRHIEQPVFVLVHSQSALSVKRGISQNSSQLVQNSSRDIEFFFFFIYFINEIVLMNLKGLMRIQPSVLSFINLVLGFRLLALSILGAFHFFQMLLNLDIFCLPIKKMCWQLNAGNKRERKTKPKKAQSTNPLGQRSLKSL